MRFSIIIPLYNKENYIKRAIESVLRQTHEEFEILVVDDGSTDSSYQKVASIKDSRIRLFRKNNGGVSSARNYGIKHSLYEYVGFLDADDIWKPQFLESIVKLITEYPEAGAYATSYEFREREISKHADINVELKTGQADVVDYFKGALNDPLISASSVVIKKNTFKNVGLFSTKLTRGEDLDMWCRIALRYQIVFLNETLAVYYKDSDNKATNSKVIYSKSFMSRAENLLYKQKKEGNNSPYFEEYMIARIMSKVKYLIKNKKNKKARKVLWKYKHTKYNRKKWFKYYMLSFRPIYFLHQYLK